ATGFLEGVHQRRSPVREGRLPSHLFEYTSGGVAPRPFSAQTVVPVGAKRVGGGARKDGNAAGRGVETAAEGQVSSRGVLNSAPRPGRGRRGSSRRTCAGPAPGRLPGRSPARP